MSEKDPKPDSRRENSPLRVYCTEEEKEMIKAKAKGCGLTVSTYLRNIGINYEVKGILDQQMGLEMCKVNGDLGRLGGLLKMWLSNEERLAMFGKEDVKGTLLKLLSDIDQTQDKLKEIVFKI
ncbi:plasmid mobilization protein [Kistimonas asteriae]|uniref:plasmid mobilization protein n=1 Tax=Kistimonas asteriae TaxID=517724 RepID=UPI001BA9004D|nr:conjugal transfer protein TraJ [Kistimonas asteriae]